MKKFFVAMMIVATTLSVGLSAAEAKRVGGGGSIGKQSNTVSRQQAAPAPTQSAAAKPGAPAAAPGVTPPKPGIPWKGILGGALLGLGLGALFSSLGIGGAMASMLSSILMVALLAGAGFFIYRMWKRRSGNGGPQPVAASAFGGATPDIGSHIPPAQPMGLQSSSAGTSSAADSAGHAPWGIPADFDVTGFVRHAKTHFIRLQAAWDKADVNDVREFTSPEMFAELKLQMQERGSSPNNTDVVTLDAEMLGIETVGNDYLASVKFTGMIREADHAPTEPFAEVWNLSKPIAGSGGWVLAGIQQLN